MSRKVDRHPKITYPTGCRDLSEELSNDELVKRLKMLTKAFQEMAQDENRTYKELALHLASEFFLDHGNKDIKLLVACCIADIFRVFVPDAPYTEPDQLKEIFFFLIEQLKGLKDTESPSFKRYFYLLENLAWVKSFNISLELAESSEIIFKLFKTVFELINEKHSNKVSVFILDILCPMLSEADTIPQEVMDIFLGCIIEPFKSQNRPAYEMARDLIKRTSSVIESYIEMFLTNCLMNNHKHDKSSLSSRVYDLIQEINIVAPNMLQSIFPQLEFKLKSSDDSERMAVTRMLSKMFSAPDSDLALQHKQLWGSFLSRFNDIDLNIRRLATQVCQDIIIHHPELITNEATGWGIADSLKHRQHDSDENVRMDVVKAIVGAAKVELKNVPEELLDCVKERTLDKKFKVRREALVGLGQIYRKCYENDGDIDRIGWIRNKILHAYYQNSVDDKILVERILNTSLVPYSFEPPARMKQLYRLYSNLDEHAIRALQEIFKTQFSLKNAIKSILDIQQKPDSGEATQALSSKIMSLSRHLPEPEKAVQQLQKFFKLIQDTKIKGSLQNLISPQCNCKKAEEHVKEIIRKLGNSTPQNLLYATVKQLLERVAPVMIDNLSILALTMHVDEVIQSTTAQDANEGLSASSGLKLLLLLSVIYPSSFQMQEVYACMLKFTKCDDDCVVDMTMQIIKNIGTGVESTFPEIHSSLLPVLQKVIKIGTMKQAKHAIRCIDTVCKDKEQIFAQLFEQLQKSLNFESSNYLTSIVAIGHLTQLCPAQFSAATENIISKFIFQELLMKDRTKGRVTDEEWYADHLVSEETQAKIQSLKMIVRWLTGVKNNDNNRVTPTLRMLYSMVLCEGDLMEMSHINKPEMARLRLQAGCCMLKLAQEHVYAEAIKLEQFETMALLINDPCVEVRQHFVVKLHKGLMNLRLPIQYMGILCLGALDPIKDRRTLIKQMLSANINRRRDYIRQNPSCTTSGSFFSVLPDYVIPFAVHLLAHDPDFKAINDINALRSIRDCLLFLIDPLLFKNDTVSFNFYTKMLENIKSKRDAQCPDSEEANSKLYAVCDLAMSLLVPKISNFTVKTFSADPRVPSKLYKTPATPNTTNVYISADILAQLNKGKKGMVLKPEAKAASPISEIPPPKSAKVNSADSSISSSPPQSPVSSNKSSVLEPHGNNKLKSARGNNKAKGGSVFVDSAENIGSTRSRSSDVSLSSESKRVMSRERMGKKEESSKMNKRASSRQGRSLGTKKKKSDNSEEKIGDDGSHDDDDDENRYYLEGSDGDNDDNKIDDDEKQGDDDDECAVERSDDECAVERSDDDDVLLSDHEADPTKTKQANLRSRRLKNKNIKDEEEEEGMKDDDASSNEDKSEKKIRSRRNVKANAPRSTCRKRKMEKLQDGDQKSDADVADGDDDDDRGNNDDDHHSASSSKISTRQRKQTRANPKKRMKVNESQDEESVGGESASNPTHRRTRGGKVASYQEPAIKKKVTNGSPEDTSRGKATTTKKISTATKRREGAAARAAKKYEDFEVVMKKQSRKK